MAAIWEQDKIIDRSLPREELMALGREALIDHKLAVRLGEWKGFGNIIAKASETEVSAYREHDPAAHAALRKTIEAELIESGAIKPEVIFELVPDDAAPAEQAAMMSDASAA